MNRNQLNVYVNEDAVGELIYDHETDEFLFTYLESWKSNGFELAPGLPFGEKIKSTSIKRFLENLFPEGNAFEELKEHFRVGISNTFAVIKIIGKETTGALTFLASEELISKKSAFREITRKELAKRLDERVSKGLCVWDGKMRLSVAGLQDKLPVIILENGQMGFGEGNLASTHILKFQKKDNQVPCLVINEFFCMSLAKMVGIDVPEVSFTTFGSNPALIVKRFDRHLESSGLVRRLHIIDGCQALNLLGSYRYERNFGSSTDVAEIREGVSFKKLMEFALQCDIPAINQLKIINWMIFNLLIGNSDAHGKNISFFVDKKGMRVAPFYDLVSVLAYPGLDHELAMSIGDEFNPGKIYAYQLAEFCNDCGIKKTLLASQLKILCNKIEAAMKKISLPEVDDFELKFVNGIKKNIRKRLAHFNSISGEISKFK